MNARRRDVCFALALAVCVSSPAVLAAGKAPVIPVADQIGAGNREGALALEPGKAVRVEKVLVADCRVGRGFISYPVDGRLDTRDYPNVIREYPASYTGTNYELNNSNGLHVTLADGEGFDAVLLRGGYAGEMFRDAGDFEPGAKAAKLAAVLGKDNVWRIAFGQRQRVSRASFFYTPPRAKAGVMADVSFLRVDRSGARPSHDGSATYTLGGAAKAPDKIAEWMETRFGGGQRVLAAAGGKGQPVALKAGEFLHALTPAQPLDKGVTAVGLAFRATVAAGGAFLTARVQDPLDPRRELMGADFLIPSPGAYEIILDMPDQVFLPSGAAPLALEGEVAPPPVLWLSLASGAALTLTDARVTVFHTPRAKAMTQAMPWRKLLLKGQFCMMSEPRPWGYFRPDTNVRQWLAGLKPPVLSYRPGLEELFETVEICRMLDPADDVVRQYHEWIFRRKRPLGPWTVKLPEAQGAPRWALLLREATLAARRVPQWWLANRLAPSGEFGSYICDDTDLFQVWSSVPLFDDQLGAELRENALRIGRIMIPRNLANGLNRRSTDPLHAYEEGINHLSLCAWWFYGDPVHLERAMEPARNTPKLMVTGGDGRRYFHGRIIGAKDMEKMGAIDVDGPDHPLMLHPAYLCAWYNRNPAAVDFLSEWCETWFRHQKPGQWATSVDVKTGAVKSTGAYPGLGGYRSQTHAWLGTYQATGDARFLKPYFDAIEAGGPSTGFLSVEPARFASCPAFVVAIEKRKPPFASVGGYAGFLLTGNKALLLAGLEEGVAEWQRFGHMYTSAEPFTDRVFMDPFETAFECQLGAYVGRNRWTLFQAASHEGLGPDAVALVSVVRPDALRVAYYNLSDKEVAGRTRVWRLDHGVYSVRLGPDKDDDGRIDGAAEERTQELGRYAAVEIKLPPRALTVLDIQQTKKLDDLLARADLALSPLDTTLGKDGAVKVVVHNIGAKAAAGVVVAHTRQGRVLARKAVASLAAPLDLMPRTAEVAFGGAQAGDEIVVDPDNAIPEIAEHNNRVRLR